ncbi:MAG TPA: zf-HC2 domain-containing protein [Blastocatellia bacterium]|nr:zf-HC2 domain-containing protein [Blastocatellia bacterium]
MFNKHVIKQLSAYCHGELPDGESRRVAEHLLKCERCRKEYDEINLGVRLAQQLPQVTAPAEMWGEIEALLDAQTRRPAAAVKAPRFVLGFGPQRVAAVSALLVILITIGVIAYRNYGPRASWGVTRLAGAPKVGGSTISGEGRIRVGDALVTDNSSRAEISVGAIGQVQVEPNSRVRLVEADVTEHRLALDRGKMRARIYAPPKLFFVDTPSAEAIDLGCAYTLEVDDEGRGFLHVTSGWVMLVLKGRESYVPIGAMCETRPGAGPGTPYFEDASQAFREALSKFDFEGGGDDTLKVVLDESRDRDTFTLWHLIQRVDGATREEVLDRMIALVGLPKAVTREGIMELNRDMLEEWKDELDTVWF